MGNRNYDPLLFAEVFEGSTFAETAFTTDSPTLPVMNGGMWKEITMTTDGVQETGERSRKIVENGWQV